ncbi:MFS transporter [Nonomuraea sp. NBC_01738]|uniref:MFS transporter n=1 Tax=Nonomuraea sp. NBC_01738 TaxID=2976003 RepID=UPI002E1394A3|nr:MFS transporter [Nonomuraea sp. NBC_01738]
MTTLTVSPVQARWLAVTSVAVGTFTVVTSEMLPVGLLTSIAADLGVSDGTAGLMVSVPGFVAAVSAPVLAITTRRLDRRIPLLAMMGLLVVANLLAAVAPTHPVMLAARLLAGVSIGGFWAFASGLAPRLVPERAVGRATSVIMSGVSVALVLGVPASTFLATYLGWRATFLLVAGVAAVVFAVLAKALPVMPGDAAGGEREPLTGRIKLLLVITALIITGHFAAYTYLAPFLEQVAQAGPALVGTALLLFGAAGVVGNFVGGGVTARHPGRVLVVRALLIGLAAAALAMSVTPLLPLAVWGAAYGGVGVALQLWIMRWGGRELATAAFVSAFNVSVSLGSFLGGRILDGVSAPAVMWAGAGLALVSAAVAGIVDRSRRSGS